MRSFFAIRLVHRAAGAVLTFALAGLVVGQPIQVVHQSDPIDDSDRSRVIVRGTDLANSYHQPYLVWRCDGEASYDIYAAVDQFEYLGNQRLRVSYRFDQQEATDSSWNASTEGTAAFVRGDSEQQSITRKALDANILTLAIFDFQGTRHVSRFEIGGIESYLHQLECMNPSREATWRFAVGAPHAQVRGRIKTYLNESGIAFQESDTTIRTPSLEIVIGKPGNPYAPQTPVEITGTNQGLYEQLRASLTGDYVRIHGATFSAPIADVYQAIKQTIGDRPHTEELNVVRTESLTVRFYEPSSGRTRLTFDGTDTDLYLSIIEQLREQF